MSKAVTAFRILAVLVAVLFLSLTANADRKTDLSDEWHKSGKNVLTGFRNMYQPHVIYEPGDDYPFHIWFFGWATDDYNSKYPGCDAIFYARAKTLDSWEIYCGEGKWDTTMNASLWVPVLYAQNLFFDSWHTADPSVVKKDGKYYMLYSCTGFNRDRISAMDSKNDTDGDLYCVMAATSPDGIHWTRSKRPVLISLVDIGGKRTGELSLIPGGMYHRPSLMFDDGKWKCWFDYWEGSTVAMGYAECPADSFMEPSAWKIINAGKNPMLLNWPNPDVIKVGKKYYSYADSGGYGRHPWKGRQICEAVSDDGINWKVTGHIPPESDTPATHVPEALALEENGRTKIIVFYGCQVGGPDDNFDYRYNRIRYMWRYEPGKK